MDRRVLSAVSPLSDDISYNDSASPLAQAPRPNDEPGPSIGGIRGAVHSLCFESRRCAHGRSASTGCIDSQGFVPYARVCGCYVVDRIYLLKRGRQ